MSDIGQPSFKDDEKWQAMTTGEKIQTIAVGTIILVALGFIGWIITAALYGK